MNVRFKQLRPELDLWEALLRDGWRLSGKQAGAVDASHSDVEDEVAARRRLHRLGLLTSATLRIEFNRAVLEEA